MHGRICHMVINNTKGFSLVELMATMLIMGVILMNLTAMMRNQNLSSLRIQAEYDMTSALNDMGSILSNPGNCVNNIHPSTLTLAASTSTADNYIKNIGNKYYVSTETLATPIGNSRTPINSFVLTRPATGNNGFLSVHFVRKGTGAEIVTKKINLNIIADAGGTITSCNSIGFRDPITVFGIKSCPSTMEMIGTAGVRSTFCIDKAARGDAASTTFEAAALACSNLTETGFENLGSAHLCDFSEWNKACTLKSSYTNLSMTASSTSWEWIASAPTSTADATPTASTLLRIGASYTVGAVTLNPCMTVDKDTPYNGFAKYRCCFH